MWLFVGGFVVGVIACLVITYMMLNSIGKTFENAAREGKQISW